MPRLYFQLGCSNCLIILNGNGFQDVTSIVYFNELSVDYIGDFESLREQEMARIDLLVKRKNCLDPDRHCYARILGGPYIQRGKHRYHYNDSIVTIKQLENKCYGSS